MQPIERNLLGKLPFGSLVYLTKINEERFSVKISEIVLMRGTILITLSLPKD